jgi:hypothetical protein
MRTGVPRRRLHRVGTEQLRHHLQPAHVTQLHHRCAHRHRGFAGLQHAQHVAGHRRAQLEGAGRCRAARLAQYVRSGAGLFQVVLGHLVLLDRGIDLFARGPLSQAVGFHPDGRDKTVLRQLLVAAQFDIHLRDAKARAIDPRHGPLHHRLRRLGVGGLLSQRAFVQQRRQQRRQAARQRARCALL